MAEQEMIDLVINGGLWIMMIIFAFGALIVHPLGFIINLVRLKFANAIGSILAFAVNLIVIITCAYFLAERGALYL
jgi:hypothetical protein